MTKVATIVLRDFKGPIYGDAVGVDYGAWVLLEKKIPMLFACGDFDSVNSEQKSLIQSSVEKVVALPEEKDVTDFAYALSLLKEYERIYVYGAMGGRKDHEYLNLRYLKEDARLVFLDEQNKVQLYHPGSYTFKKTKQWRYFSVLPLSKGWISLKGFKYPLDKEKISPRSRFLTSNELIDEQAVMILEDASAIIIFSND